MSKGTSKKVHARVVTWTAFAAILLSIASLDGCTSAKKLVYFQGATSKDDTIAIAEPFIPTIKKGDVLSVQVSSLNAEASAYFNPVSMAEAAATANGTNPLARTVGYVVANDGTIKLPLIGQVAVADLTNAKAGDLISSKLKNYLKEPTVNVRNLNFRISVLGEVSRPALFTIPTEQITIPEALGLAGDLTVYGRRDNVLVIREEKGKRIFTRLDLTQRDAFRSPYYTLHPNDIVYVEPGKARATSVDRAYQLAPILTGILSIIAIIATRR
ncbi:polysaccharide biosynthesis/export family protein [Spirosoma pulveris]